MKYFVRMAVVDAFRNADMGDLCVDDVRGEIVYIQDESGNFLEEGGVVYANPCG